MKRTVAFSALALTVLTGAASAMTQEANQVILERYAPSIDVSDLSDAQVASLLSIVYSGDSAGDKRALIQHLVN